ncbi:MAG TPA: uroporphyrinogen decarboxylase family protein [bacterium]|nr:uroporphyrinogen decarboxylase family protein [bacterium]
MTGRELVRRAARFQGPERVPRFLPEPWGNDFFGLGAGVDPDFKPRVEGEDEFGCVWVKLPGDRTMGQVKVHPLSDYRRLADYRFPDYTRPGRYQPARDRIKENREERFVLFNTPLSLIHRLEYLRGHVEAYTDPYLYPKELEFLLDHLTDISIDAIRHGAEIGVDGIISCDDWGLQDRPMLSPEIFRRFFKPRYARAYGEAHRLGLVTFLHSCGHIVELLDDLIESGLDVIQMDQQENMGLDLLSRRFGGRLCFWCPVDIQQTMIKGSPAEVAAYARRLIYTFGNYNGGFISKWYNSPQAVNHDPVKIEAMARSFVENGNYPLK